MKLVPAHVAGARGMLKMSRAELAAASGVAEKTIWNFEEGGRIPHDDTLQKIQEALERRGIIFHNGGKPTVTLDPERAVIPSKLAD